MGLDPRRASSSAQGRSAQTISELETRVARLENSAGGGIIASGVASQTAGSFTITTTTAAIPGMTVSLTAQVATLGIFIVTESLNGFGGSQFFGALYLNGVSQLGQVMTHGSASAFQATVAGIWRVSLPAGTNTLDIYGVKTGAGLTTADNGRVAYFQARA